MSVYITCSRNPSILSKRFVKYLTKFLPALKYIPRGKTSLNNIFKKLEYLGVNYFIVCFSKDFNFFLRIYKFTKEGYLVDKELLFKIIDLRSFISFKDIELNKFSFYDSENIFYFLDSKYKSKNKDYGLFLCENNLNQNVFEFRLNEKYLGFKLELLNCDNI